MAIEKHMLSFGLSSALSDAAANAADDGRRRALSCKPFPAAANAQVCVAAWHAVLHWLRYNDEPVISCLLNARARKSWPIVTETNMETSLGELLADVRNQWMQEESGWLDLDDCAHAGLLDQLRCHAVRLHDDRKVETLHAEFEIVATQSGWEVECAANRFTEAYQRRVMELWRQMIVRMLESPDALLSTQTYGGGGVSGPVVPISGNLIERFAEQVARHPLKIATVDCKESHTYAALDRISSSWARSLRAAGVAAGQCVGVAFERNWKMVAAQLAVLKLGAVFVPMDTRHPKSRLQAMADDTTMSVALTEDACIRSLAVALPGVKSLSVDDLSVSETSPAEFSGKEISTDDLAYVVFTSGSTGRPKGVKVSHGNLLNFVLHFGYVGSDDVLSQFAPFTFDASVAEIYLGVLSGARLVILTNELIENPDRLQDYMTEQRVTFAAFPPPYARHLSPSRLPGLKTLITAGSATDHELIKRWQPHLTYVNGYGPTETTVVSTVWRASHVPDIHEPIVIGSPIANTEVRVVNRFNRALPRGVIGELLIGGAGVAQGYIKRRDLTRERFIESDHTRWYRSGDLSCFNDADELIFAGRVDNQVKLRGHRLEPGEVETALLSIPGIRQAAVLVADIEAASQLVAFCVGERQPEEALRERLRELVPSWAIPNQIAWLDSLPFTVNGKTDYKQLLRDWQHLVEPSDPHEQDYADELEAKIAEIWGGVLQRPNVSRDDNFIHLGGDSLTALVVMSALKRLGYTISSSQLLTHPRLADFAALLKATGSSAQRDYAPCEGVAPPSPIQGWFFDLHLERPGTFCQTLIFETAEKLEAGRLHSALAKLTRHHDQLRARFVRDPGEPATRAGWHQEVLAEPLALAPITLEVPDAQLDEASERCRLSLADELHIEQAPLFRMALLVTPTRSRVVWVLHHLLVDTVSHGILLEDLRQLYEQVSENIEQVLPGKSISYLSWSNRLLNDCLDHSSSHLSHWQPMLREIAQAEPLPLTRDAATGQPLETVEVRLSRGDTARLIEDAAACYHQSPEEIVLAATYLALSRTFKVHRLAIDVEWHGRDEKVAGTQGLDRTIGWFTSVHPVCMQVPAALELGTWLIDLKETRARVANRGRDFYALLYLSRDAAVRAEFAAYRSPQVLFNFSGVVQRRQGSWRSVPAVAIELGEGNASPYDLSVESEIRAGELVISLYHQPAAWPAGAANPLARTLMQSLKELIAHCCEPSHERWTPADFPQAALTQSQVDELPRSVKAVYPLTDMQQTMLRHKDTYQVFMCYRIPRRLNESRWRVAIADWISRHDCLRTYIKEWSSECVRQVVLEAVEPPVNVHRTAPDNGAQLAQELLEQARRSSVQLTQAPLFDIQTADDGGAQFRCVLTIHHIIHDGWSIELLLTDLVQTYLYYCGETDRRPTAPLASIADVVAEQSRLRTSAEWRAYWAGLPWQAGACELPDAVRNNAKAAANVDLQPQSAGQPDIRLYLAALDEELISAVRARAHSLGVTINSLWLTGYVCLLRFLGGQRQVRCGVIHSGRMEQIPGVETITGCCVNTLPLVLNIEPTHTLAGILADVNSQLEKMRTGAVFPLSDIHNIVRPKIAEELFGTLFNIESHLYGARREDERATLESGYESTNYSLIFGLIEGADSSYGVRIGYNANRYDTQSVERWLVIYARCMRRLIESADVPWNRLQMLPEDLWRKLVLEWNATQRPYPHDRCVAELFREQAARLPEHPALLYHDREVSYRELDARSEELARLLQAKGVEPETVVGLVAERSLEGIIAILAIFKAGGAYVPLDPRYPAPRIRHMVQDVGCKLAIFQRRALSNVVPQDLAIEHIYLDEPIGPTAGLPATVSTAGHHSRQLAYVMYTSGSTGNPKGVMIEQRSIVRLVKGTTDIAFTPADRHLLTSAPGFDITTFEIWIALLNGLTLAIADEDTLLDPERLAAEIRDKRIDTLCLIVPLFNRLVQEKPRMLAGAKRLILVGDAVSPPHAYIARQANPHLQVIDGYGPTENTAFSTYHFIGDADSDCVPIGRPLTNSTAYIFNSDGQLLPPGVNGELVVGGPGVARGYLNQPELTAAKFIRDPFSSEQGACLYRTGDLARWREDGLIDFLGRMDNQVKIRGFRVELGEIENAVLAHDNVKQALVLIRKQDSREQLIAYIVPKSTNANDGKIKTELMRSIVSRLQASLPDYMVPAAFVMLDAMPRNTNGKIDRDRLPEPDASAYIHNTLVEPANDAERVLWAIWKEVLGADSFGVTDAFYAIGGDSILAIQVVARAAKQGLAMTTRQIIEGKTIRTVARHFEGKTSAIVQPKSATREHRVDADVTGEQRLLPIQLKLLQDDRVDLQHYNQYVWIDLPEDISREKLQNALSAIVARHDVLRLRFRETPSGWVAHYRADVPEELIVAEDLSEIAHEWRRTFIENAVAEVQASLDIKQGRLCRWLWINDSGHSRLLWVMHHLSVDGVSWRVLLGDLEAALAGSALAPKSSSYQEWATSLHERAFSAEIETEKPYWLRQLSAPTAHLKLSGEGAQCREESTHYVEVALSSEDTTRLLHKANRYYNTHTQQLLIAALTRTLGEWLQSDDIRIDLEGHGREERDGFDLSQTVGWFTTLYPVHFGEVRTGLGRHIRQTQERLSAVPGNGVGYGILSFLTHDDELHAAREQLQFGESEVLFNYLGQFDAAAAGGSSISPRRRRTHPLRINAFVSAGALFVRIDYSKGQIEQPAFAAFAEQYLHTLREIIEHCAGSMTENGPAQFPLAGLSQAELGELHSKYASISDIYPCTGMQQGLLMYTGRDPGSGVYLTQLRIELDGVEPARLRRCWQELMKRHAILRTAFADVGQSYLLQLVLADAPLPWHELDARGFALGDLLAHERVRPFDMSTAPLMRLLLVRETDQRYRLVWTHHHALLDGWSMALLIRELLDIYAAFAEENSVASAVVGAPAPTYKDYIQWLQHRDREAAARYWRAYLQGADITPHACLPVLTERERTRESSDPAARHEQKAHTVELAAEATALLTQLARSNEVSLGTLMLAAWGLLLSKYGSTAEVLFGYASSGRPDSLPGVESIVGLFITSLPLRLKIDGDGTLASWLKEIQGRQLDHEEHSFVELAEIQRLGGLHAGQTLFDSLVVVENYPLDRSLSASVSADGLRIVDVQGVEQNDFPLNLVVYPGARLTLKLAYQTRLFADDTISTLVHRLLQLLISFGKGGEQKIAQLSMLTSEEQTRAVQAWNDTKTEYPSDRCLPDLFTAQALAHPEVTAIVSGTESWTYQRLSNRVQAISGWLSHQGVAPGDKVALSLHKEPDLIASMVAIMHAGAAYVPVALDCPSERRAFMAADARIKWTLTKKAFAAQVETPNVTTLLLDEAPNIAQARESQAISSQAIAYIIYTSGTTGRPKGVAITQRNLVNFCSWFADAGFYGPGDALTQFAPYTFDASAGEIFCALLAGAELHLLAEEVIEDPRALERYLSDHRIRFAAFPPPYLQQLEPAGVPQDITILTAGSAPTLDLVERWGTHCRYVNGYGPTETTIISSAWKYNPAELAADRTLSIGRPISNTVIYLVDPVGQLCAPGLGGEILIGGDGVAHEYVNRSELTQQKFIRDPWTAGGRLYRTGDLGRWLPDGRIEFIGRRDRQMKVRGFRIELGEIESRLREHPAVKDAAVAVRGTDADAQVLAWVVFQDSSGASEPGARIESLRSFLREALPPYMLPQAFVPLDQLPLTPHGKVDEKALPQPDQAALADQAYVAPRNEYEKRLTEIWAAVLKGRPEQISATSNFFELGGHSLLAMRVISRVRQEWGVDVAVTDLFRHPVLEDQAVAIQHAARSALPPVTPVERDAPLPLSFAQQRLWFTEQIEGVDETYHIAGAIRLTGVLDREALGHALDRIVARHEILRTTFKLLDGEPAQRIGPADCGFTLKDHDLSGQPDAQGALQRLMDEEVKSRFDFENGPLARGRLVTLGEQEHVLLMTVHHIVMDGWSMDIMIRELSTLYRANRAGQADPMPALAIQYADYAVWQRRWLAGAALQKQGEYWRRTLEGAPALTELPTDRPRPARHQFKGELLHFEFDESLTAGLKALSQRCGTTMFMTLLAGWSVVLSRLSGQQDIVIGAPVANRTPMEVEPLIGCFLNAIAVRMDVSASPTVRELLEQAKMQVLGAQQHQQVPFEKVVEILQPPRSLAYNPIFQVWLNWLNLEVSAFELGDLQVTALPAPHSVSRFDLKLGLSEAGRKLTGSMEYATALFDRPTVERHIGYLRRVLEAMVLDEHQLAERLPLLGDAERRRVLAEFNATRTDYPREQCIHQLFEAQAARDPDAAAVEYNGQQLTYGQLNRRANQVARELISRGVRPDDRVAICVERSLDMVVGVLGILKAGGAYVPLDPTYPAERLAYLLQDCTPVALLIQSSAPGNIALLGESERPMPVVALDEKNGSVSRRPDHNPDARALELTSRNLAYVIYTSGSTGQPKGVMVEHASAVNFWQVLGSTTHRACRRGSRVGLNATYTFDKSLKGLLQLLSGRCVVLIPQSIRADGEAMLRFIEDSRIDVLDSTPSQLDGLLRAGLIENCTHPPVSVLLGGEPIGPAMWQVLKDSPVTEFFNMYGPTECTVDASITRIRGSARGPNIGKPIANTQIYVLDSHLQPVPIGVTGEMYLGGAQVARGYLRQPELTAQAFLKDPFAGHPEARMYKTGDLARYLSDGTLEYVGRRDFQVKIRGFRIELGEIESCLMRHSAVREAVVIARDREQGDKRLVAYVTQSSDVDAEDFRKHLRAELPDYMVPTAIVRLDALPLTRNGKIDRDALPDPSLAAFQQTHYEAPSSATEEFIASIWQELLEVPRVGRQDSFFDLGGNSILLIRMLSELRQHRMMLNVTDAYRLRTLAACSEAVAASARDPLAWLQSSGWKHKLLTVSGGGRPARVLLLDQHGGAGQRELQKLLAQVDESRQPDFVRICADIGQLAEDLEVRGLAALTSAASASAARIDILLSQQLAAYQQQLASAAAEAEFPFSPTQQNLMPWNSRDGLQCFAIQGWYGTEELQSAFSRLVGEQDLLRSIPDMERASWRLLPAEAASRAALPTIDLRMSAPDEFKRLFKQIAEQLLAQKKQSSLPYTAVWVSASDMRHYLVLAIDHLIWDGASAVVFQRRLAQLLSGSAEPLERYYRDYVEAMRRAPDLVAWQRLQERFEHGELSEVMGATLRMLDAKAHLPLQVVRFKAPVAGTANPASQAFEGFRQWLMSFSGLSRFATVFNHHGRQLGERAYFDQVGLFLDKLPFVVDQRTQLEDVSSGTAHLHGHGLTYLGLEYAAGPERAPVLPPLGREIIFNYQAYGHSQHELRDLVVDAAHIREKLEQNYGVVFEASVEDGHLLAHCSFRGERRDIDSLLQCFPGCSLEETGGPDGLT